MLVVLYVGAGINHFINAAFYASIMPPYIPVHPFMVALSGVAEILFGFLLIPVRTRKFAAYAIALMLVVFISVHIFMLQQAYEVDALPYKYSHGMDKIIVAAFFNCMGVIACKRQTQALAPRHLFLFPNCAAVYNFLNVFRCVRNFACSATHIYSYSTNRTAAFFLLLPSTAPRNYQLQLQNYSWYNAHDCRQCVLFFQHVAVILLRF